MAEVGKSYNACYQMIYRGRVPKECVRRAAHKVNKYSTEAGFEVIKGTPYPERMREYKKKPTEPDRPPVTKGDAIARLIASGAARAADSQYTEQVRELLKFLPTWVAYLAVGHNDSVLIFNSAPRYSMEFAMWSTLDLRPDRKYERLHPIILSGFGSRLKSLVHVVRDANGKVGRLNLVAEQVIEEARNRRMS